MEKRKMFIAILFATVLHISNGCQIDSGQVWDAGAQTMILDIYNGIVFSMQTTDIADIRTIRYGQNTRQGPYFDLALEDTLFVMRTNDEYRNYEENEINTRITVTVTFGCSAGSTFTQRDFVFSIDIDDTNNNAPQFLPSNVFEFTLTPPLPPGFSVTGCLGDITVRDIDLTTQRIDFAIEDNEYFEIEYDESITAAEKEFKAQLRTKTLIRSLSEPITLTITATDVALAGPPLSTNATLRIIGDSEFQFPEEPIFDQTFYLANYTVDHQLNVLETISLRQGFDENVIFSLDGEYKNNFAPSTDGNRVSIVVVNALPDTIWPERNIFLIIRAEREYTSGDSTTVIVQMPEEEALVFESTNYRGTIEDNSLQLSSLVLSQGYEGATVTAQIIGEYMNYFTAATNGNLVTISMEPEIDEIIENKSFILLEVVATTQRSRASTIVNLEIIKDDNVTPAFDKSLYSGSYDPITGLTVDNITFVQGFDETVAIRLDGEYADNFQFEQTGMIITVTSTLIPPELYRLQNILISIEATKPRTVGANAAINIALPAARELEFEENTYRGAIQDNVLSLGSILLRNGYEEGVYFNISGEYADYFSLNNTEGRVTVDLSRPLSDTAITQNNLIILTLTASGVNVVTTTTTVLLDIIKDDNTTPVFTKNIYYGTYSGSSIEVEAINLAQGFDSGVSFRLDGDHAQYFEIEDNESIVNNVVIRLRSQLPEDLIFNEKVLLFNVLADKALTVGANAAVLIKFPTELTDSAVMKFSRNTYISALQENNLTTLDAIVLDTGYVSGTEFILTGEYVEHFKISNENNVLHLESLNTLPNDVFEDNNFLALEIEARRQRAVSVWASVVIDIAKEEVIAPVFGQAYYKGVYTETTGLTFEETIQLSEGFDDTVTFMLSGESATWFLLDGDYNNLSIKLNRTIPAHILETNNQLLFTVNAHKPNSISGQAVISIDLPKELKDTSAILRFDRVSYFGTIENDVANIPSITVIEGFTQDIQFMLHGDLKDYFSISEQGAVVTILLQNAIPEQSIPVNRIIMLEIQAISPQAISAYATVVIQAVWHDEVPELVELIFAQTFYSGSYSDATSLSFPDPISLAQGYDLNVEFNLEGDSAQWFNVTQTSDNSVTVILTSPIPAAVIANNQHLVFIVTAQRPGSATARATIIISLIDELTDTSAVLGFDRVSYFGTIENDMANIPSITVIEGFTQDVQFMLHGDLKDYFSISEQGAVVTILLQNAIPEQSIPANRIIMLEIQAISPQAISAYATVVIQAVWHDEVPELVELIFAQTFYSGSYSDATSLSFPDPISLAQGYDSNVEFNLEGDSAQWFNVTQTSDNSVTVILTSPIPAAVIANNQHLVFIVTAQRPGSATARATIIISLIDDLTDTSAVLGFDRVSYFGTIENDMANIPSITVIEGFTQDIQFMLHGDLKDYFIISEQGAVVTILLQNAIPEQSIPANRIIMLEIQAISPQAISAYATVVIQAVWHDEVPELVELIFAQTFYSGSYSDATSLSFPDPISLAQGYDSNVEFNLEGDSAQWFNVTQTSDNSVTVILTSPIPAAVIANNQHLVFIVTAQRPGSATARATIIISLIDDLTDTSAVLGFDRVSYFGTIENDMANIPSITVVEGFTQDVQFMLHGDLKDYFSISEQGAVVTILLQNAIPEQSIPANRIIMLEIQAISPQAISAYATVVIQAVWHDEVPELVELIFAQTFYSGSYSDATSLSFPDPISLAQGYDSNVEFNLEGDSAQWFNVTQTSDNSVTVILTSPIPAAVIANNQHLVFIVTAQRPGSATARATIIISLIDELTDTSAVLGFDRVSYFGTIENDMANIPSITVIEGFTQDVQFMLHGDLKDYFSISEQGAVVTILLQNAIPEQSIPANRIIMLEIQAISPQAISAYATVVIQAVRHDEVPELVELIFAQTFYSGSYSDATSLSFPDPISLAQGYDSNVEFNLEGDSAQWFNVTQTSDNSVTVILNSPIPAAVIANNQHLVFIVTAQRPGSATARATIIISLIDDLTDTSAVLGFDRVSYFGTIENDMANIPSITVIEGFTQDVQFMLHGDLKDYFSISEQGAVVTILLQNAIPEQSIPANRIIMLEIQAISPQAISAYATVVIQAVRHDEVPELVELIFAQTFYSGSYSDATSLSFPDPISLAQGYDSNVEFNLEGDSAQWFNVTQTSDNSVTVILTSPIPAAVIANNQHLVFIVTAQRPGSATARATIIISLIDESQLVFDVFEKVLFEGRIKNGEVNHENITLNGFSGSNVELHGEYSSLFVATLSNNELRVIASDTFTLATDVSHVALELRAGTALAVLLLSIIQSDEPALPVVTFSSSSYAIRTDVTHTGLIGQVQASSNNGEAIAYSLQTDNAHLQGRLSVNSEGELRLSASVNTGAYAFVVLATTIFTQTQGTATVHLSVDAITVCGDEFVMPPLIVLDVDEEESHYDLINGTRYDICHLSISNRWPLDQTWLYVDERGLHTTAIDREHESIAFMPVSQVQVEVILHCDTDSTRSKRSLISALGPYDYGNNKWVLTDTILYNSRRSFVNVIVNDINDNAPIFVGKQNEPIAVGCLVPKLVERVLPRSLIELQATDADIGENAALLYWSSAPELAVAPITGFVHLRDGASLENDQRLTINATDRNGEGLTGSIDIVIRLLDESYVAVVTIRDAFLDDEQTILSNLSEAVGYDIRVLRSVVISTSKTDDDDDYASRKKRDVISEAGASLQLYVYGLIEREPVSVDKLTTDISNTAIAAVNIANAVSLEDHLEAQEICVIAGRDIGLLVATIVLSVLLFAVLVAIAVWFYLRWRKNRSYDQFTDENSLPSRKESSDQLPRPEILPKPRLDIGELKKSERRLQEMLDAPVKEVMAEPRLSQNDAILDMPTQEDDSLGIPTPEPLVPIVIQSIDKLKDAAGDSSEDEFGEIKIPKRKSVVTFNENVEKIIHVEDLPDVDEESEDGEYEIYKL